MKTILLAVGLLLMSSVCWGQSVLGGGGLQGPTSNTYVMPDHPQHADYHAMSSETTLVGGGSITVASGEQPLWQFGSDKVEEPLGDVARRYRLYDGREKARIRWEAQGEKK